jgi:hypothetical protein
MTEGFTIFGVQPSDLTGWSVSGAGDVNNDTFADIIIGAPYGGNLTHSGAVYVIYGAAALSDVHLFNMSAERGFAVFGSKSQDALGLSVSGAGETNFILHYCNF